MTEDEAKSRGISKRYLRPILPSPRHLRVNHVEADGMPTNAERRYPLDCTGYALDDLPSAVRAYLETGVETTARGQFAILAMCLILRHDVAAVGGSA